MEIKECPICKNTNLTIVCPVKRYPYLGFSVAKEEKDSILQQYSQDKLFAPLKLKSCNKCRHVFQAIKPDERLMDTIYNQHYNYPSPMLTGFAQERENIFLDFFSDNVSGVCKEKKLNKVLEIACFDGFILKGLSEQGFEVCGCDPSKGADIANSFGIKVHKRFFESSYFSEKKESFDIIIFRHFIEHVYCPVSLFLDVKKLLSKYGLIIFETPNVEYYLKNGSFETFNLQHLQAFSLYSVNEVLKKSSLNLVSYKITPQNLIVVASAHGQSLSCGDNSWSEYINSFKQNFQDNVNSCKKYLKPFLSQNKKIVLWGAGSFCGDLFSLYEIDEKGIDYVVDIDERKWDMVFMNNNLKIFSPDRLLTEGVDLIIITSMYSKEIIKQIREMNISSDIINLHPKVSLIKKSDL